MGCTQSVPEKRRRRSRTKKSVGGSPKSPPKSRRQEAIAVSPSAQDDYAMGDQHVDMDTNTGDTNTDLLTAPAYDPHTLTNRELIEEDAIERTKRLEEKYEEQQRQLAQQDADRGCVAPIDTTLLHTPSDVPATPHEDESSEGSEVEGEWNVEDLFAATTRGNHVLFKGGILPGTPTSPESSGSPGLAGSARKQHTIRIYHKDLEALLEGFDLVRYGSASSTDSNASPTRRLRATFSQGSDNIQIVNKSNEEMLCDIETDPQCDSHQRIDSQGEVSLRVAVKPTVPTSRATSPRGYVFDAPNGLASSSGGLTAAQLNALATGFRQLRPPSTIPRRKVAAEFPPPVAQSTSVCTQPPSSEIVSSPSAPPLPSGPTAADFIPALDQIIVDTAALPTVMEASPDEQTWDLLQSIPNGVDALNAGDILFKFRACSCADLSVEDRKELATFVNLSQFHDEAKENCCPPIDPFDDSSLNGLTLIMVRMMSVYPHVSSKECNVDVITSVDYQKSLVVGKETFETVSRARTFRKNKTVIPFVYSFVMQMTGSEREDAEYNRRFVDVHSGMVPDRAVILERTKRNMTAVDSTVKSKSVNLYYDVPMPDGRKCTLMSHTSVILKSSMPTVLTKMLKSIGKTTAEEGRKQLLQSRKFLRDRTESGWDLMKE